MIRQVPLEALLTVMPASTELRVLGKAVPCAVTVDGGVAVAMPEPDLLNTWALTVFDPTTAAAAATRVLGEHAIPAVATTTQFGFPIVEAVNPLLRFAAGLRMTGSPTDGGWVLADYTARPTIFLAGPDDAVTITWWDENGACQFAYPVAVVEGCPSELERSLAAEWGLPLHHATALSQSQHNVEAPNPAS